eukprot:6461-Amphidinium_carterae.1
MEELFESEGPWLPLRLDLQLTVVRKGHLLFGQAGTSVANRGRWHPKGVCQVSFGGSRPLEPLGPEGMAGRKGMEEWLRERPYDGPLRKPVTNSAPPNEILF